MFSDYQQVPSTFMNIEAVNRNVRFFKSFLKEEDKAEKESNSKKKKKKKNDYKKE